MADDEERQLRIDLMKAQIDHERLDIERIRQQIDKDRLDIDHIRQQIDKDRQAMRWEPLKAIATILAGVAAMAGVILGVAHLIH